MIRKILLFLTLSLVPVILMAGFQTAVSGFATDSSSSPIADATVTFKLVQMTPAIKPKEYHARTDAKGAFNLKVDAGTYEVTCEKQGYRSEKRVLNLSENEPKTVLFILIPDTISGEMTHVKNLDPKTARVFITVASLELKVERPAGAEPSLPEMPYSTIPELGGLLYGGNPMEGSPRADPGNPSATIASFHDNSISLLDTKTNQVVAALPTQASPIWIAFSHDGSRFWTVDSMRNLAMYSGAGDLKNSVNVGENLVSDLAVGESRVYLAVRSWPTPMVMTADAINNSLIGNFPLPKDRGQPGGIALSRDGRVLIVTMGTPIKGWLEVLDSSTGRILHEIEVGRQPLGVGVTPDGSRAVVANYSSGTIGVVDLDNAKLLNEIQTGIQPARVCIRPDGHVAFVSNNGNNSLSVIDPFSGSLIDKVPVGKGPLGVAASPDGSRVYVANHDSANVTIVDGMTFAVVGTSPQVSGSQVFGVAVRP